VCARKWPILRETTEPSFNRIVLDIPNYPLFFIEIADPLIKIVAAPECAGSAKNPIRFSGALLFHT
jgi:hypothetical protein